MQVQKEGGAGGVQRDVFLGCEICVSDGPSEQESFHAGQVVGIVWLDIAQARREFLRVKVCRRVVDGSEIDMGAEAEVLIDTDIPMSRVLGLELAERVKVHQ